MSGDQNKPVCLGERAGVEWREAWCQVTLRKGHLGSCIGVNILLSNSTCNNHHPVLWGEHPHLMSKACSAAGAFRAPERMPTDPDKDGTPFSSQRAMVSLLASSHLGEIIKHPPCLQMCQERGNSRYRQT